METLFYSIFALLPFFVLYLYWKHDKEQLAQTHSPMHNTCIGLITGDTMWWFITEFIYGFTWGYIDLRIVPEPVAVETDQEILNRKCHEYLKGDHW